MTIPARCSIRGANYNNGSNSGFGYSNGNNWTLGNTNNNSGGRVVPRRVYDGKNRSCPVTKVPVLKDRTSE